MKFDFEPDRIDTLIQLAIQEDIFTGDITTENLIPGNLIAEGAFVAKESGVIAGLPAIEYFFSRIDKGVSLKQNVKDGAFVNKGETIATAVFVKLSRVIHFFVRLKTLYFASPDCSVFCLYRDAHF